MATTHTYQASLVWSGSTGVGYRRYGRTHRVATPPAGTELEVSADPSFGGDAQLLNPEQLLLAAAVSCQLLSFLALAARDGIDVVRYEDDAQALMPAALERMRITAIVLRPRIVVADGTDVQAVLDLVHHAHGECYIANALDVEMTLEPTVEHGVPPSEHR